MTCRALSRSETVPQAQEASVKIFFNAEVLEIEPALMSFRLLHNTAPATLRSRRNGSTRATPIRGMKIQVPFKLKDPPEFQLPEEGIRKQNVR